MADRDDRGRFGTAYDDADFLDAVREHEPAGTAEIADAVGCHEKSAYKRLRALADGGMIGTKQIGGGRVWFAVD
jgi:predicted transcriptional regulator